MSFKEEIKESIELGNEIIDYKIRLQKAEEDRDRYHALLNAALEATDSLQKDEEDLLLQIDESQRGRAEARTAMLNLCWSLLRDYFQNRGNKTHADALAFLEGYYVGPFKDE